MVKVRNVNIGQGTPKICVPVTAVKYNEIIDEIKNIHDNYKSEIDIIELRIDFFEDVLNYSRVNNLLSDIRKVIEDIPLLFTFRTKQEGGEMEIASHNYKALLESVLEGGMIDLIDVEIMLGSNVTGDIIKKAAEANVAVIASNHDFNRTPDKDKIINILMEMERAGADIAKIAVMPANEEDVITLLQASVGAKRLLKIPAILISMGQLGMVSRITGEIFGSAVTFGTVQRASAPGQPEAAQLKRSLQLLSLQQK